MDVNDVVVCSSNVDSGAASVVDTNGAAGGSKDGKVVDEALRDSGNSMVAMACSMASGSNDGRWPEITRRRQPAVEDDHVVWLRQISKGVVREMRKEVGSRAVSKTGGGTPYLHRNR